MLFASSTPLLAEDPPSQDPMGHWITETLLTRITIPVLIGIVLIIWFIGVCYWSFQGKDREWLTGVLSVVLCIAVFLATPVLVTYVGWLFFHFTPIPGWWSQTVLHPHLGFWGVVIWLLILVALSILIIVGKEWPLLLLVFVLALPLIIHHWLPSVAPWVWSWLFIRLTMLALIATITVLAAWMMFYTAYQVAENGLDAIPLAIGWFIVLLIVTALLGGLGGMAVFMETLFAS